jgi:GNAT superfamily N-acetyltransferase
MKSSVVAPAFSVRPIASRDRAALARFYASLSPESRVARFHGAAPTIGPNAVGYFCVSDRDFREGIVAEAAGPAGPEIVGHLVLEPAGPGAVEMGVAVADAWHRRGIGRAMLLEAVDWARDHDVQRLTASMRLTNVAILGLVRSLGLPVRFGACDAGVVDVTVDLGTALPRAA